MIRKMNSYPTTNPALEYAAILSGFSMGGDFISEDDIKQARHLHTQRSGQNITFVSPAISSKR